MPIQPRFGLLIASSSLCLAVGCKTPTSSSVSQYETAEYAAKDICQLVRDEAERHTKDRGQSFAAAYEEVFQREAGILALLVPKARACSGPVRPNEIKPAFPAPPGTSADAGTESGEGEAAVDASAAVPAEADSQCEGLTDPAFVAELVKKQQNLKACAALPADSPGLGLTDDFIVPTAIYQTTQSELCKILGLDTVSCAGIVNGSIGLAQDQVTTLCQMAGTFLKAQPLGKYDSAASRECGADIVQDLCARNVAVLSAAVKATDDAERQLHAKVGKIADLAVKQAGRGFMDSLVKCAMAFGKEKIKDSLRQATTDTIKSAFASRLGSAEEFLKSGRNRAIIGAACAVGAGVASATLGKYEAKDVGGAECKDLTAVDKQRGAACVQTVKELGCDAVSGTVDLGGAFHIEDDASAARLLAEVTSGVVEGACAAGGGRVGTAACSIIAKSSGYIADAFRGKSNPWADCLGTPAMGACFADNWHYWTTGVKVDDYKVGIADSAKKPDEKFYNRVCWCWRKCMSDDWGTDREVSRHLYWQMAEKGDAGTRFCASKERELKWPVGLTWERGRRNVYIQYTSCDVADARGKASNLWDDQGYMEIKVDGSWQWYQFPRTLEEGYMGCGGKADGGT